MLAQANVAELFAGAGQTLSPTELLQLTTDLQIHFAMAERQLGGAPENGRVQSFAEATQLAEELSSRFKEVSQELSKDPYRGTLPKEPPGMERESDQGSASGRMLRPDEIASLPVNAQSQFAAVNQMLGVRPRSAVPQSQSASASGLPDLGAIDASALSRSQRQAVVEDALAEMAELWERSLPVEDVAGAVLFAVEASGMKLRLRYRLASGLSEAEADQIDAELRRRACTRAESNAALRLGGQYEYVLHDSGRRRVDQFTISQAACS